MGNFFVNIYNYLRAHSALRWGILLLSIVLMTVLSLAVKFEEDINSFFPKNDKSSDVFKNLKAKDKIAVMFTADSNDADSQYLLMDCVDDMAREFAGNKIFSTNARYTAGVEDLSVDLVTDFVYNYLPFFLTESDYIRLDSIVQSDSVSALMTYNYDRLISPVGNFMADYIYRDPLGVGSEVVKELQNMGSGFNYAIVDNYLFSKDGKTLISYIELNEEIDAKSTKKLITAIESVVDEMRVTFPGVEIQYFGVPIVAEYNARQIKKDSIVTMNIALILVLFLLSIAFRNKYSALLVLMPVLYGVIFSLSIISLVKGNISIIAVGSGSIIFGIALSYSIHMLSHTLYCSDIREVIKDLSYPLTVGSFTTVGAFAGLLFTSSTILQDLGLFASLTLVGTTIFVLIFLPHFIKIDKNETNKSSRLLNIIDRFNHIFTKINTPVVVVIIIITVICSFFADEVVFDSNMMNINYEPEHLKAAEERLSSFSSKRENESNIFFLSSSEYEDEAASGYNSMCSILDSLKQDNNVISYSSIGRFVVPDSLCAKRLARWNQFWQIHNSTDVISQIEKSAIELGFEDGTFDQFIEMLSRDYQSKSYKQDLLATFPDWINSSESIHSYIAQVQLTDSAKNRVYKTISNDSRLIAADRSFFANMMAEDVNNNFSFILYLSAILVFAAMLICYGRIEITLMAFAPMFVSWIVILGIMAMCGIEFNIVTIILSTFIFGIGDDFSIFMMDGLLGEYKDNKKVLAPHKTAIFFSAFTVIVGMGVLVFAKHPAMNSLGVISLLGILIVVIVSYTLQPAIFRLCISKPTESGGFPITLFSILNTIFIFGFFVVGCILIQLLIFISFIIPIGKTNRINFIHFIVHKFCKNYLWVLVSKRFININDYNETFKKPAVIIANHQSFIDILVLLALNQKSIMVTNNWVWNSPVFGGIVRYLGFINANDGYEAIVNSLEERVKQGYSIVIFPEGTRSVDCKVQRFHKGAFYLAEQLELDILPILFYGNGLVSSKRQGLYIKKGILVSKIFPRITVESVEFGTGYRERTKLIAAYCRTEFQKMYEEYNCADNNYFKDALIKNYIYKGPVVEWYMRVKLRLEGWYDRYDKLLPRKGMIVDLGCGYGAMSYMLAMLSDQRTVLGVDYDQEKIALANHSFSKNDRIEFKSGDIRKIELPEADAFVISDVLHYIGHEDQRVVINRCIDKLREGGVILIKDGDSSLTERHENTLESERWSTKIIKFNKTDGELCFLSREMVEKIVAECGARLEYIDDNSKLSNVLFVIRR